MTDREPVLIPLRCGRGYRIAAKYWELNAEGEWVTTEPAVAGREPVLIPLIVARCVRCGGVAAKYWEYDGQGKWVTPAQATEVASMVASRVCRCEPPPTLPEGGKLAGKVDVARRKLHSSEFARRRRKVRVGVWITPHSIRV